MIEYKIRKKNSADGLFQCPDYMNPSDEPMHIIGYVIKSSIKTQKIENSQVFQELEIISESESDLKSQFTTKYL